jgi:hypothetical protein
MTQIQKYLNLLRKEVLPNEYGEEINGNFFSSYAGMRGIVQYIDQLEAAIRKHRDQRLDDRCWMDEYELYEVLPEGIDPTFVDLRLLPKDVMMRNCEHFVECRTTELTPEEAVKKYKCR